MKILFAHNYYKISGGEDIVVKQEIDLLNQNGHTAKLFFKNNLYVSSLKRKIDVALNVKYSESIKDEFRTVLKKEMPDIVHVHNFFSLITPSIYDVCIEYNIPVVQTLHNFRITCAGGLFLRKGSICESCKIGNSYKAVLRKCYRNSYIGSFMLVYKSNDRSKG